MSINPLARELNDVLAGTVVEPLLSDLGKRIFFPKGIIAQSAEAKKLGKRANGTIGMALQNGAPMILPGVQRLAPTLKPTDLVTYAPTAGFPEVRELWQKELRLKNPALGTAPISLPVAVGGLSAGISILADLFLNPGDTLVAADPSWDNYSLIAETRRDAAIRTFPIFTEGPSRRLNIEGLEKVLLDESTVRKTVRVILNFPQNPTGYSPTAAEARALVATVKKAADTGAKVLVIADDAYFGLRFEEDIEPQSLFAHFATAHENILAAKVDGPTKEDFLWGFRLGFLTFASKGLTPAHYDALVTKLMGLVRSTVSCCSTPAQTMLVKAYADPDLPVQKAAFNALIRKRYQAARAAVDSRRGHPKLEALPFNSGYFMSFRCHGVDAEQLRQYLLKERQIGAIAIDSHTLRVAFSSLEEDTQEGLIEQVFSEIYAASETF